MLLLEYFVNLFFPETPTPVQQVNSKLEEGRSWLGSLDDSCDAAAEQAELLIEEANALRVEASNNLDAAEEGRAVVANFRKILNPNG